MGSSRQTYAANSKSTSTLERNLGRGYYENNESQQHHALQDSWRSYRNDTTNLQQMAGFVNMKGNDHATPSHQQTPFQPNQNGTNPTCTFFNQQSPFCSIQYGSDPMAFPYTQQPTPYYQFQLGLNPTAPSYTQQQPVYANRYGLNPAASSFQPINARPANPVQSHFSPYQPLRVSNGMQERTTLQQARSKSTVAHKDEGFQFGRHPGGPLDLREAVQDVPLPSIEQRTAQFSSIPALLSPRHLDTLKQFKARLPSISASPPPTPSPTQDYMARASLAPVKLTAPKVLLVVLDLNGTLLKRRVSSGTSFTIRPGVTNFMEYLFANHVVMIYSSARPENTQGMVNKLFHPCQRKQLAAVWARDKLELTQAQYHSKVQVYKRLEKIWGDKKIQNFAGAGQTWDQTNTVLVDDSHLKASAQPYNLLRVEEFLNDNPSNHMVNRKSLAKEHMNAIQTWNTKQQRIISDLQNKLEELKWTADASRLIRTWQLADAGNHGEPINDQSLECEQARLQLMTPKSPGFDTAIPEVNDCNDGVSDGTVSPVDEAVWKEILGDVEQSKDEPRTPESLDV